MPNTKHIYNMIELIDKEKIRGRKMSDIKVSIIMPVYKVEEYVGKAIESIQAQTLTEWEFIIVDDGTPDKSGEICDAYAEKDNRIKVIHKENGGLSSARNVGLDIATGDWIAFVDSDDYIDHKMYDILYKNAEKNNCDISICYFEYINQKGISLYNINKKLGINGIYNENEFLNLLYKNSETNLICVCVWNKLYKKEIFKEQRFKEIIHEDEEIFNRIYRDKHSIYVTELPLYKYVQNSNSIVNKPITQKNFVSLDILYDRINIFRKKKYEFVYKCLNKLL